jgi:poly-gamma-glutamate synthesis protein (capsule biosynthesis protein)
MRRCLQTNAPWAALTALAWLAACAPAPPVPQTPPPPPKITLVGVGDILLGRQLGLEMDQAGDYSLPFQHIAPVLKDADIAFGNFEGVFCEQAPWPASGMVFRIKPERVKAFVAGGFDVVSVANNHTGDGGDACIAYSAELLRANGVATAGSGADFNAAHAPAIVARHGVQFAFLAYTYEGRNDRPPPAPKSMPADAGASFRSPSSPSPTDAPEKGRLKPAPPGPQPVRRPRPVIAGRNLEQMKRDVAAARALADIVMVSLHDGAEYTRRVARETEEFARAAIDAGATAVLGHHPHVPQRVEPYNGGWIFYSLGNFAFQQQTPPEVRHTLIARLTFTGKSLTQVEAIPGYIETFARPRLATGDEAAAILKGIGLSDPLLWSAPHPATPEPAKPHQP